MAMSHEREQLIQIERRIASAKERIAWHKQNIEKLTREGRKTDLASAMLAGSISSLCLSSSSSASERTERMRNDPPLRLGLAPVRPMARRRLRRAGEWRRGRPHLPVGGGAAESPLDVGERS
jgi:hypothetical protein